MPALLSNQVKCDVSKKAIVRSYELFHICTGGFRGNPAMVPQTSLVFPERARNFTNFFLFRNLIYHFAEQINVEQLRIV